MVIHWLYEQMIGRRIRLLPEQICFMLTAKDIADAPGKLLEVACWCRDCRIRGLTFHISTADDRSIEPYVAHILQIATVGHLRLHYRDGIEELGEGMDVTVAVGKSGREEIADCIRKMARDGISPEAVDEDVIESYLTFKYAPDLVIKTGGDHLTDFLIWQSVYSELFFSDVNWKWFRKVDFLRALRDYQSRKRRFGR